MRHRTGVNDWDRALWCLVGFGLLALAYVATEVWM
jgi:hypothetical protein